MKWSSSKHHCLFKNLGVWTRNKVNDRRHSVWLRMSRSVVRTDYGFKPSGVRNHQALSITPGHSFSPHPPLKFLSSAQKCECAISLELKNSGGKHAILNCAM
ncbi:hypothetical protein RRG08_038610 [Elysia crispata]|uniref:Uncharacterized protein n=1 Tax=Elysia crispata TaxID=231223 RepID=A0AAE1B3C5_9GAST|nr:hypothetical protein RRG08_038610 [Elysia crispata]